MTIAAIADTHAVIWSLFGDSRLSAAARAFIGHAAQSGASVGASGRIRDYLVMATLGPLPLRGR